jgi:hypothetical protein
MKKMMFLVLTLLIMGAANVNAQVRIGGTDDPHLSAVLDLNANNDETPTGNAGGLALPRVELANDQSPLNGVEPKPGTVVYNTGSTQLAAGTYVWTPVAGGGSTTPFTGISVDNTGTGTTVTGNGTDASKIKVSVKNLGIDSAQIATNAVRTLHIKDNAVTAAKLSNMGAATGQTLMWNGSAWVPAILPLISTHVLWAPTAPKDTTYTNIPGLGSRPICNLADAGGEAGIIGASIVWTDTASMKIRFATLPHPRGAFRIWCVSQ